MTTTQTTKTATSKLTPADVAAAMDYDEARTFCWQARLYPSMFSAFGLAVAEEARKQLADLNR